MTDLITMSEREYFAQFAQRIGMFIGRTTLSGATAFMGVMTKPLVGMAGRAWLGGASG